jgi:2-polyprenyl-3-methyl-5-hydroxy-6-metoxy-1,4-benzoquinol methylase
MYRRRVLEYQNLVRKKKFKGEITYKGIFFLFSDEIKNSVNILDIGAGNGILIKKLNEKFQKEAVGIDLEPESESVMKGSINDIPFGDDSFDFIICTDVIEHLSNDIIASGMKEIHRVLRPDGKFAVTTLLDEELEDLACKCPDCGKVFHRIGHIQRFKKDELVSIMLKAGLKVEKVRTIHLGAYSKYNIPFRIIKRSKLEIFAPSKIKKLFNKDIVIICSK